MFKNIFNKLVSAQTNIQYNLFDLNNSLLISPKYYSRVYLFPDESRTVTNSPLCSSSAMYYVRPINTFNNLNNEFNFYICTLLNSMNRFPKLRVQQITARKLNDNRKSRLFEPSLYKGHTKRLPRSQIKKLMSENFKRFHSLIPILSLTVTVKRINDQIIPTQPIKAIKSKTVVGRRSFLVVLSASESAFSNTSNIVRVPNATHVKLTFSPFPKDIH